MSDWSKTEATTLINLWPTAPAAQIARRLQRSRNAMSGKAKRLRLDGALSLAGGPKHFRVSPRPRRAVIVTNTLGGDQPCSLYELTDCRCHWPLGNVNDVAVQFCGDQAVPGQRYCAHHLRIASKG